VALLEQPVSKAGQQVACADIPSRVSGKMQSGYSLQNNICSLAALTPLLYNIMQTPPSTHQLGHVVSAWLAALAQH
jgi:hypothetical protein